ncbi:MAG TPA: DUF1538 domain-containing protein, partial [Clostridia bacterium]|nr:DUF1538 domain-containing protein [Clostridia bacterium]
CFTMLDVSPFIIGSFLIGAFLIVVGMGLFTLGVDMAIMPMGESMSSSLVKTKKPFFIIIVFLIMGFLITLAEPDLQILATQIATIPDTTLILAVGIGVGIAVAIFVLKILLKVKLSYILIGLYGLIFILSFLVDKDFVAVAFDAGGVTTGPMCVPFVMALCLGLSNIKTGSKSDDDGFGMVSLTLIGPIIAVLILGMFFKPESSIAQEPVAAITNIKDLLLSFAIAIPNSMKDVGISLVPIVILFVLFQFITLKLPKSHLIKIFIGVMYNFIGLTLFFVGVNIGFMPMGKLIGAALALTSYNWILIIIGAVLGFVIVLAEPSVPVLNKQVEEITGGAISKKSMLICMCIGISIAVALSMVRILTGLNILYFIIPGYIISLLLSFFVPSIFTSIAFDSGAVASGPMTAVFMLPLAMGATTALGGNIYTDAFGLVTMVAMVPTVTIQILGLIYKIKTASAQKLIKGIEFESVATEEEPIDFDFNDVAEAEVVPAIVDDKGLKVKIQKIVNNVKNKQDESKKTKATAKAKSSNQVKSAMQAVPSKDEQTTKVDTETKE